MDERSVDFWWRSALCAQTDRELWFEQVGGHGNTAKKICRACPVRVQCLMEEICRESQGEGIYAGFGRGPRTWMQHQVAHGADPEEVAFQAIENEAS